MVTYILCLCIVVACGIDFYCVCILWGCLRVFCTVTIGLLGLFCVHCFGFCYLGTFVNRWIL